METKLNKLCDESWKNLKDIIVFGYGRYGRRALSYLKKDFNIIAIIDNDIQKRDQIVDGVKVINFNDALEIIYKYNIIVTVQGFYYQEICKQLEDAGLVEHINFTTWIQFFTEWYYKYKRMICVEKTDIPITSFCSLNCKNCSVFTPYIKKKKHEKIDDIRKSVDLFFEKVDKVLDMNLYGGEPFLHPQLCEIIDILANYRDRIGYLGIITNGTIIPDEKVIDALKRYNIGISISDYTKSIDYADKLEELCRVLEYHKISITRTKNMVWFDLGFPPVKIKYNESSAKKHMEYCNMACHDLIGSKIYYCIADRAAQMEGLIAPDGKSYINLMEVDKNDLEARKEILELCAGNVEGGYLEFCKICGGYGHDNQSIIPAARQKY
ncbi:hypothetical protein C804_01176 [Lachnospiraceae bacterium A4]|nr:hypothetical protein C804_01176 [Lachnospiraceae bacterium A4]